MEDVQASKKESQGEKMNEMKEETLAKKQKHFWDKKSSFLEGACCIHLLNVPITQPHMAVEGKGLLARPKSAGMAPIGPSLINYVAFITTMTIPWRVSTLKERKLMTQLEWVIAFIRGHIKSKSLTRPRR
ncbi:UNVERIFIED_CONTAM: hypothetical protein Sangu_1456300 [Sesamum angustifolium]|uniref:Uncharacterized protein n=1 Tax=Sesamum angustifolium TaxID=2727405 RepID=A0AAW2N8X8_9LAMI